MTDTIVINETTSVVEITSPAADIVQIIETAPVLVVQDIGVQGPPGPAGPTGPAGDLNGTLDGGNF